MNAVRLFSKIKVVERKERAETPAPLEKLGWEKIPAISTDIPAASWMIGAAVVVRKLTTGMVERRSLTRPSAHFNGLIKEVEAETKAPGKNQQRRVMMETVMATLTQGFSKNKESFSKP